MRLILDGRKICKVNGEDLKKRREGYLEDAYVQVKTFEENIHQLVFKMGMFQMRRKGVD